MRTAWWYASLIVLIGCGHVVSSADDLWQTDMEKAAATAKASGRYMLLDFTGSDWCGWCMKLDAEVFSQKAFREYAEKNLVCVKIDFPRRISLPEDLKKQNDALLSKYAVRGFPTIIILSPSGETVGRTGYQPGGADSYVRHLKSIIDAHRAKSSPPAGK